MAEQPSDPPMPVRQTFSAPAPGFFAGADRQSHLERLQDPSAWPQRVLLVTGPRGVGKSTLCRQLVAGMAPGRQAARINGALVNGVREVLGALVHGFGLRAPEDAELSQLTEVVAEHVRSMERQGRGCIAFVDDADLLESRALDQLLRLVAVTRLRLLMFGEARLASAVDGAAAARDVSWQELRLREFSSGEVGAYLEWRFHLQGYTGVLPFSDSQVKEIARLSEGLPGRIDQIANVLLTRIQSTPSEAGRRFPLLHRALVAVLVVAIAFTYMLWTPSDQQTVTNWAPAERLQVPPPLTSDDEATQTAPAPARQAPETSMPAARAPAAAAAADAGAAVAEGSPLAPASEGGPDAGPGADAGPEKETRTRIGAGAGQQPAPPEPEPSPAQDTGQDAAGTPLPQAHNADWIMRQPPGAYTVQLVTFSSEARASAFLARQADPAAFARFRRQQGGAIFHVVIYGTFDGRRAAEQAAGKLPASVGGLKPWVRTFGDIQAAVRTALQR